MDLDSGVRDFFTNEDERSARMPLIYGEPRLDHQCTAESYIARHAGDGAHELLVGLDDTDRAEQTGDDVVGPTEIEIHHVGTSISCLTDSSAARRPNSSR